MTSPRDAICKYLDEHGTVGEQDLFDELVERRLLHRDLCSEAAKGCHLGLLECALANGFGLGTQSYQIASELAGFRALSLLKIVVNRGCELNASVCAAAARGGDLETLKYLREMGCKWDEKTCDAAAEAGNSEVMEYAITHACPMYERTRHWAALNGFDIGCKCGSELHLADSDELTDYFKAYRSC